MGKRQETKKEKLKIELVTKTPYKGSGPRGIDVYASKLAEELSKKYKKDKIVISHDQSNHPEFNVTHYTFFDPFFVTLWGKKKAQKFVVTVHDLIPLKFPNHFPSGIRGKVKWLLQKLALKKAAAVITDSVSSKNDIHSITGIAKENIFVVPLAASQVVVTDEMVKTVRDEYKLPKEYLLYVGDINWNKNIPGLIRAFAQYAPVTTHLVLVGKAFISGTQAAEYQEIEKEIKNSGSEDRIHKLGFVPSHHLPSIYKNATLYVQPSWYEGFGFPVLEAMTQECPVYVARTGSLPEVGGEYAHYFNPSNEEKMGEMLKALLENSKEKNKFVHDGKKWAASFTWKKVVKETHRVYEEICSNS